MAQPRTRAVVRLAQWTRSVQWVAHGAGAGSNPRHPSRRLGWTPRGWLRELATESNPRTPRPRPGGVTTEARLPRAGAGHICPRRMLLDTPGRAGYDSWTPLSASGLRLLDTFVRVGLETAGHHCPRRVLLDTPVRAGCDWTHQSASSLLGHTVLADGWTPCTEQEQQVMKKKRE